jgi:hypothetical protein
MIIWSDETTTPETEREDVMHRIVSILISGVVVVWFANKISTMVVEQFNWISATLR